MTLLSKLTLVIPTYNRQPYALRNMRYWSGSAVTVHVLDGSAQPIPTEEMADLGANVNYHHWPIPLLDRFARAVALVKTEYAALLGDDEFLLPDGLQACIREMEIDETLVSCMGRCLGFGSVGAAIIGWPVHTEMAHYAVLQDDPVDRMTYHMNPYVHSTNHSVVRSPVWTQAIAIIAQRQFSVYASGEIEFELAVCYHGKSKVIEDLMLFRSSENDGIKDEHDIVEFHEWWADKNRAHDREEFLKLMANALADGDAGKLEWIRQGVKAACDRYCEFAVGDAYRRGFRAVLAKIGNRLPPVLKAAVKAPVVRILVSLPGGQPYTRLLRKPLVQAAKELEAVGVRVDMDQLSHISKLIEQFHVVAANQTIVKVAQ